MQDRTALIGGREAQSATLRNFEQELAEEETKLKRLGAAGDVTHIEAAIDALLAKPVTVADRVRGTLGLLSERCTKVDARTASGCHQVALLRADLATAAEKTRREERIAVLRQQLRDLRERGAADAPDPVAELFAWLSRGLVSVRDVGFGFPVAFGLLIELISAFGPIGIVTYAASTRPRTTDAMASPATLAALGSVVQIEHQPIADVVDFVAERTLPAEETSAIGAADLHLAYVRWSADRRGAALDVAAFTAEFDRLRELPSLKGKIRKFGALLWDCGDGLGRGEMNVADRDHVLPASLAPRGLSRVQAAAYIGVSPSLFDEMVKDERMPQPIRINSRVLWDRVRLDEAFASLADAKDGNDPWGKVSV